MNVHIKSYIVTTLIKLEVQRILHLRALITNRRVNIDLNLQVGGFVYFDCSHRMYDGIESNLKSCKEVHKRPRETSFVPALLKTRALRETWRSKRE